MGSFAKTQCHCVSAEQLILVIFLRCKKKINLLTYMCICVQIWKKRDVVNFYNVFNKNNKKWNNLFATEQNIAVLTGELHVVVNVNALARTRQESCNHSWFASALGDIDNEPFRTSSACSPNAMYQWIIRVKSYVLWSNGNCKCIHPRYHRLWVFAHLRIEQTMVTNISLTPQSNLKKIICTIQLENTTKPQS